MKLFSKKNLIVFSLFILINLSVGQNELLNHKKYWYYKTRLQNDLMKVGLLPGESLPFNERGQQNWNTFLFPNETYIIGGNPRDRLKAGDASARLGIYISALALEYKLLQLNGQDLTRVKFELFCALSAINRLDFTAESIFSSHPNNPNVTVPNSLNGFFIRDDVPDDFVLNNYNHFNYNNNGVLPNGQPVNSTSDFGFCPTFTTIANGKTVSIDGPNGQLVTIGDKKSFLETVSGSWEGNIVHGKEESQDQAYYIMMACALVKECVDANATSQGFPFQFGAGGTSIRQQAIDISSRIVMHMKNGNYKIQNPANLNHEVQIGGNVQPVAYAVDNAACFIKHFGSNGDFTSNDLPNFYASGGSFINGIFNGTILYPMNSSQDFRLPISTTGSPFSWHSSMTGNWGGNINNNGIMSVLASVCNCYFQNVIYTDLNVQNQISGWNTQLNNAQNSLINLLNQLSNTPQWFQNIISGLIGAISALQLGISYIAGAINTALNVLTPGLMVNFTDKKLKDYCINEIYNTEICSSLTSHTGNDLIFPVYVRDILHQNNGHPNTLPTNIGNFVLPPPGHLALKTKLQNALDVAPCRGNFNLFPIAPGPEWGASNRCDLPMDLWRPNNCINDKGDYSGTDYMLMHNLFYLREGFTVGMQDYSFRKISANLPLGNQFTTSNIRTFGAYEKITADNSLASNSGARYRAGKEIALLPNGSGGFGVAAGSDFGAFIAPFLGTCANEDMFKTNGQSNSDDMGDELTNYITKPVKNNYVTEKIIESQEELFEIDTVALKNQFETIVELAKNTNYILENKIEIYPNPNNGEFNITFNLANTDNVSYQIINALGQIVQEEKYISGMVTIPVAAKHLNKGVYTVKFSGNNAVSCTKKITIQ